MLSDLVLSVKDLVLLLWYILLGSALLWFISHIVMAIIKTLFCDTQIKLYKIWCKQLKQHPNDSIQKLEKK